MNVIKSIKFRFKKLRNRIITFPVSITQKFKYRSITEKNILAGGGGWSKNFGDALNTILIELLSEKEVIHADFLNLKKGEKVYVVIGSILQWVERPSVIWGAGFISSKSNLRNKNLNILAVRGPLTKSILEKDGIDTSNIALGDPALLLPYLYNPNLIAKKYKIGIIPHYADKNNPWITNIQRENSDVTIIDIMCGMKWKGFIDQILSCDIILSSSLHGLIVADAYGIATQWISFSNKVQGHGFKFKDYYSSINYKDFSCSHINEHTSLDEVIISANTKSIDLDILRLINSCPFITEDKREKLLFNNSNII